MKLKRIREEQAKGHLVAMTGDGTNDVPALAQADVGVAMNSGTQAANEAGNMVGLDSNPTKLMDIVEIGKQLIMTRCTLTDDLQPRQRHREILRRLARVLLRHLRRGRLRERRPVGQAQHHGAAIPAVGHSQRGYFQRAPHHRPVPARAKRCGLPALRRGRSTAPQSAHLRTRRRARALHRDQAHRTSSPSFRASCDRRHFFSLNMINLLLGLATLALFFLMTLSVDRMDRPDRSPVIS